MIRVIIADDEERIVKLIQFLVDWQSLDMEVVATACNGIEALEKIKQFKPEIVITDIKMPGCDGLKMIEESKQSVPGIHYVVISGYRQFEYAKRAIQHGVSNYILKPIDHEELTRTLSKIKSEMELRGVEENSGKLLEELEKKNLSRKRREYIQRMLHHRQVLDKSTTVDGINEEYGYHFKTGSFQSIIIKIDGIHEQTGENRSYLEERISNELAKNLRECIEWEYADIAGLYYLVLNYKDSSFHLKEAMKSTLDALLLQSHILENFQVTIGVGIEGDSAKVFKDGFKAAKWAIDQRLILGTNKVIQGENKSSNDFVDTDIFKNFNKEFSEAIELQKLDVILGSIDKLEENLLSRKETTGYEIYQMVKEAINMYALMLRKLDMSSNNSEPFFDNFNEEINNCGSAHDTFAYLKEKIKDSFETLIREKDNRDSRPIRSAKAYIIKHLGEPISLSSVSGEVGFNTTYFSTVFKKETGVTFSEYLLEKRMEKAKELLRETQTPVSVICTEVGYNDVKHFTKNFTKHTSLKPNEYRKLYS